MEKKQIAKVALMAVLCVFVLLSVVGCSQKYSQAEVDAKVNTEKATLNSDWQAKEAAWKAEKDSLYTQSELDQKVSNAKTGLYTQEQVDTKVSDAVAAKEAELAKVPAEEAEEVVEAKKEAKEGYELDELEIGEVPAKDLTDKHLSKLLDAEVEFDGDEYDVEEYVAEDGLELCVNGKDFGADVYMCAEEGALAYVVKFDDDLDTSLISEDETLVFKLLGQEVEVSSWDEDEVTLSKGAEFSLDEGVESVLVVDGVSYTVKLVYVDDDDAKFVVNGESTDLLKIGDKYELADDSELQVTDILYQPYAGGVHKAEFKLGKDVSVVLEDGEEYEEDSAWSWYVGENELGLVLSEEFLYLDEDEDFEALAEGEALCLPEEYVCAEFLGMEEEKTAEYKFDVDEKQGSDYLRVKGDFTYDMEDFEKLYIDEEGIYDSDLEELGDCVEMDDTEYELCLVEGVVVLEGEEDLFLELDLSDIRVASESVADEDEDYLTSYGVVLSVPEDAVDDQELEVVIPEEQLLGTILVR